jgi:hypothetical protein
MVSMPNLLMEKAQVQTNKNHQGKWLTHLGLR